nr:pyrokinin-1 receptor-like [Aedes albopictus]
MDHKPYPVLFRRPPHQFARMPLEVYGTWYPYAYPFNQVACIITGLLSETATNATVLTITSFTVERYIAICHPFRSHTMSKLSRAIKFVIAIWLIAFGLATPQALQFGVVESPTTRLCTVSCWAGARRGALNGLHSRGFQ